ncbi:hypothetical protein BMG05_08555 [Mycobacterium malmoense]|nr:hypothetical protein BMG05_08555 [Mycobacterium malmoense]
MTVIVSTTQELTSGAGRAVTGGKTDINNLALTCIPNHKLAEQGWKTRKLPNGRTEWIPPPHLDRGARTNDYHHPERLFDDDEAP